MITRAKKCSLRHASMRADAHHGVVQNKYLFADPCVAPDLQPPWQVDIHPRLDHHTRRDFCPKEPEQPSLPGRRPRNRREEKGHFAKIPKRLHKHRPTAVKSAGSIETIEAHSGHGIVIWRLLAGRVGGKFKIRSPQISEAGPARSGCADQAPRRPSAVPPRAREQISPAPRAPRRHGRRVL